MTTRTFHILETIEELFTECRPVAERIRGVKDWDKDFAEPMGGTNYFAKNQATRDVTSIQLQLVKMIYLDNLIDTLDALAGRLFEK